MYSIYSTDNVDKLDMSDYVITCTQIVYTYTRLQCITMWYDMVCYDMSYTIGDVIENKYYNINIIIKHNIV